MDRMLYVAMSGAKQITRAQTVNTHNLANVSTDGLRAELINFQSLPLVGEGHSTRVYAQHTSEGADYTHGAIRTTGRNLDVALRGDGWFVVQGPDGNEAYTRAGNFQVSANGLMTTRSGLPVLGEAGPIALPPAQKIEIADDGTVSMQGQDNVPAHRSHGVSHHAGQLLGITARSHDPPINQTGENEEQHDDDHQALDHGRQSAFSIA